MRITAEYHGNNHATVYFVAPLLVRLLARLIGRCTRERHAIRSQAKNGGLRWQWWDGRDVPAPIARALTDAYREHLIASDPLAYGRPPG